MNLAIDIGNSVTKTAIFDNNKLVSKQIYEDFTVKDIIEIKNIFPKTNRAILSAVGKVDKSLIEYLENNFEFHLEFSSKTSFPFKINYQTPETLGNDRIAAVAGAYNNYPDKNVLIIDIGTAVTYELLTKNGEYIGGNISPGLTLRYKSLFEFTENLPLLSIQENNELFGTNTNNAIVAGVQNGLLYEIEGFIAHANELFEDLTIIFTGGDSGMFAEKIKSSIFVLPNLVLIGLNRILNYNAKKI